MGNTETKHQVVEERRTAESSRGGVDMPDHSEGTPLVSIGAQRRPEGNNIPLDPFQQKTTLLVSHVSRLFAYCIPGFGAKASLQQAWCYFEYLVLPRRVKMMDSKGKVHYAKAPPGHIANSTLYPAWTTPITHLRGFGSGVTVYFETLLSLSIICLIAGLLYIPSIQYYGSDGYTSEHIHTLTGSSLRGSLICPAPVWVPCPDCPADQWKESPDRYAMGSNDKVYALKNTCAPLRWAQGLNHLLVMVFLAAAMFALGWYQRKLELKYDESELTASDFTIQVVNSPSDATDPDEWERFFSQFGTVVYVTVALNNSDLLKQLQKRRAALLKASHRFPSTRVPSDKPLQSIPEHCERQKPKLFKQLTKLENDCRQLIQNKEFPTSSVFITFDKEADQRRCLRILEVGQINVMNNNVDALEECYLFRKKLVLDVLEPTEPTAIRWQDLDETWLIRIRERTVTYSLSLGIIVSGFWLVKQAYENDDIGTAAVEITLLNIVVPRVFKAINSLESHPYDGDYQASLYWKVTIFRWVNSALVTILIKPFPETLADTKGSLIASVHAVLRAEIMIAPLVHLLDVGGFLRRMILAPFAPDQSTMNSYFHGAQVNLGEKYTNATKTVFLVFFYAAIFPSGFFYGALALFLTYVTDKYLLLRSWGPMPEVRDSVAKLSRKVFFPMTIVVLAIMSEIFFSSYPCDDLCTTKTEVGANVAIQYMGRHSVTLLDGKTTSITVVEGTTVYRFCDQDFLERLPALSNLVVGEHGDWMSEEQESMTFVFGLFSVAMIGLMIFVNLREDMKTVHTEAFGGFSTEERDSGESYSKQKLIKAYIPQVNHRTFAFPLIASDLSKFDPKHLGWKDPLLDYEYYNMQGDIAALDPILAASKPLLSRVQQYGSKKSW